MLYAKKTNNQTKNIQQQLSYVVVNNLSQNTWYIMIVFTKVAKAFHCLSIN